MSKNKITPEQIKKRILELEEEYGIVRREKRGSKWLMYLEYRRIIYYKGRYFKISIDHTTDRRKSGNTKKALYTYVRLLSYRKGGYFKGISGERSTSWTADRELALKHNFKIPWHNIFSVIRENIETHINPEYKHILEKIRS